VSALYHAHSGLRYLVLSAAGVALIALTYALVTGRSMRAARAIATTFAVLLSLQVLLGIGLVMGGLFSDSIVGHLVIMVLATATTHGAALVAQRASTDRRELGIRLAGIAVAVALITAGIMAIGPRQPPQSVKQQRRFDGDANVVRHAATLHAPASTFIPQGFDS
jgi:heme A synthase